MTQLMKFKAPKDTTSVSVQQQQFQVGPDGTFEAPAHFRIHLEHAGFKSLGPAGQEMPAENAQRVAPPPGSQVQQPAPSDDLKIVGIPAEVEVGLPATIPAKMIAAASAKRGGLDAAAWNAQDDATIQARLEREVGIHKSINDTLKQLEAQKPEQQRAWLQARNVDLHGVKNADLMALVAKTMNEAEKG